MRRFPVLEQWRNLDHRLADYDGHGIEIAAVGGKAQALRLQRDGAAAREGIVDGRQLAATASDDLSAGARQHFFVRRVLHFTRSSIS